MKTKNILSLLAMLLLLAASCTKHNVTIDTVINEDGSCSREYQIALEDTGSPSSLDFQKCNEFDDFTDSVSMSFDDSWNKSWSRKGEDARHPFPAKAKSANDTIIAYASQKFASIDAMNDCMPIIFDGKPFAVQGQLTKAFKWFYTEYTYTETYSNVASSFSVPMTDYLTPEQVAYWTAGTPNLTAGMSGAEACDLLEKIEAKNMEWVEINMLTEAYNVIAQYVDSLKGNPVTKEEFIAKRSDFVKQAAEKDIIWQEDNKWKNFFVEYFHTDAFLALMQDGSPCSKALERMTTAKFLNQFDAEYRLQMPGEIYDAGTGRIVDGIAVYRLSPARFYQNDYVITATSRVTNVWAYAILVLLIVVAIGSFMYKKK